MPNMGRGRYDEFAEEASLLRARMRGNGRVQMNRKVGL